MSTFFWVVVSAQSWSKIPLDPYTCATASFSPFFATTARSSSKRARLDCTSAGANPSRVPSRFVHCWNSGSLKNVELEGVVVWVEKEQSDAETKESEQDGSVCVEGISSIVDAVDPERLKKARKDVKVDIDLPDDC